MLAAARALRPQDPCRIVVAVFVAAEAPGPFHAVWIWYEDFLQLTDEEV
jgi:predicted phosphoribosyltransferase